MHTLCVKQISKSFHSRQVVKDVSLRVNSGQIVGLLGPNGAGKTTSFHMIVGLLSPDHGGIYIDEQEISRLPMDQRSHLGLGYLPQESSIFRKLTVAENIMAILQVQADFSIEKAQVRLENLLQEFNVIHLRDSSADKLSGGERRRVEIARALATDPLFLLLDEPFAGIDPISVESTQNIIRYLSQQGIGVLITDHNVRETLSCCDNAYIVIDGQIITTGSAAEIFANEQVRKAYLGDNFSL